jgi:hypothetical protein
MKIGVAPGGQSGPLAHTAIMAGAHRLGLVVGDVDGRRAHPLLKPLELVPGRRAQLRVEVRQRLVEQEDLGSRTSVRASATRWRSPPDNWRGLRSSRWPMPNTTTWPTCDQARSSGPPTSGPGNPRRGCPRAAVGCAKIAIEMEADGGALVRQSGRHRRNAPRRAPLLSAATPAGAGDGLSSWR